MMIEKEAKMTFEMMVMILAGKGDKVARAVEKELAPLVVGTTKHKMKSK